MWTDRAVNFAVLDVAEIAESAVSAIDWYYTVCDQVQSKQS